MNSLKALVAVGASLWMIEKFLPLLLWPVVVAGLIIWTWAFLKVRFGRRV